MSKRVTQKQRTENIAAVCFLASLVVLGINNDAGPSLMVLFASLCGVLGVAVNQYIKGESGRPSGAPAAEPSALDHLPTPVER